MPSSLGQNIKRLRERAGIHTQAELARVLGLPQPRVSDLENDRYQRPRTDTLMKLASALKCSMDELLEGTDADYDQSRPPASASNASVESFDVSGHKKHDIPVIAEGQASPYSNHAYDPQGTPRHEVDEWMSRPFDVKDPRAYGVRVVGDSMIPMFRPGRLVVVSPNLPVVDGDPVYVQLANGERLIKIVHRAPGGFLLESVNPAYEPRFVRKSEIEVINPVVWARIRA